jgi:hypothetical protein
VIVGIDAILNTLVKDLPPNLDLTVASIFDGLGNPFRTWLSVLSAAMLNMPGAIPLGARPVEPPADPVAFTVGGSVSSDNW